MLKTFLAIIFIAAIIRLPINSSKSQIAIDELHDKAIEGKIGEKEKHDDKEKWKKSLCVWWNPLKNSCYVENCSFRRFQY